MSLILEALKKSERQRRLGESPSIGSPIMAVRHRRSPLPILIGLIAIGLGALWWLNREPAQQPTPATSAKTTQPAPVSIPEAATSAAPGATSARSQPPAQPAPTVEVAQSSAASRLPHSKVPVDATAGLRPDLREQIKSGELVVANPQLLKPGEPATIKESEPQAASADAAALRPAQAAIAARVEPARIEVPAKPAPASTANAPLRTGTTTPAATPAAPPPPAASNNGAAVDSIKLMWELPYATRRELPEIRLTMHVFASDPTQRFVIINDARRVQGDEIDGLKLVEIRSDGVVFEREGVRFLYPRGGR